MKEHLDKKRILIIGDSIVGGFNNTSERNSFVHQAIANLGLSFEDISRSGMTTSCFVNYLNNSTNMLLGTPIDETILKEKYDLIIFALGNVDGKQIIVKKNLFHSFIPGRYKGFSGFIDERPYYTSKQPRRMYQIIENKFRFILKRFALLTGNLAFPISKEQFEINLKLITERLLYDKMVFVSTSATDNRLFPESMERYMFIDKCIEKLSKKASKNYFIYPLRNALGNEDLLLDRFHPTRDAHTKLSKDFISFLKSHVEI